MSRVRSPSPAPNLVFQNTVGFGAGIGVYLPLADDEATDIECNCTKPIPRPPTAPASSPSSTSTGKLSNNESLFFAILCFLLGIWYSSHFSIYASIPSSEQGHNTLWQLEMAGTGPLTGQ